MKTKFKLHQPFNLEKVLKSHGWFQLPPFYWNGEDKSLDWIVSLQSDTTKINLKQITPDFISVSSDEEYDADIIHNKLLHIFNLDLDLTEFYQLCRHNPLLQNLKADGMGRLMRNDNLYQDVFKSICGTNVQWKQAVKMVHNIAACGNEYQHSKMFAFPSPNQVLEKGEAFLKDTGRVGYRSSYLVDFCDRCLQDNTLIALAESGKLSESELYELFLSFKGIGKVTANYLMALYGYYNRMSIDSLVISYMKNRHFNGRTPTPQQVEDFFAQYGKWKYLVYWMEFIVTNGWNPDA